MKTKTVFVAALLLITLNAPVLGGAKFVKTWKNPEAQPANWKGKKVVAFVRTLVTGNREGVEQALARELTRRGAQGVPGHTLVSEELLKDREAAKRILADAGITGAVIVQVVDVQSDLYTSPGSTNLASATFTSSWESEWNMPAAPVPRSSSVKMSVVVETRVYSIDQDKLLWAGTSKTTDAKEVDKVIKDLVDATGKELKKEGVVSR